MAEYGAILKEIIQNQIVLFPSYFLRDLLISENMRVYFFVYPIRRYRIARKGPSQMGLSAPQFNSFINNIVDEICCCNMSIY